MTSIRFTISIFYLALLPGLAAAPPLAKRVDEAMRDEMARQELVGLVVGVVHDGKIAHLNGYGLANREQQMPVTRRTMFRWASISKPVTAVAAMQLWERGDLDLESGPRRYVTEFPDKEAPIRVRHLFCHLGGIVHYSNGKVIRTRRDYTVENPFENVIYALDTFRESPLVNAPGEKFAYTTHGFILLSAVVERAGKQKFIDQVRDRIAKPMKMETLQPDYQWKAIPHRAVGYRKRDGEIVVSTDTDVSWKLGGGGFISNIDDMAKFAVGLLNHRFVKPATRQKMWTPQKTNAGHQLGYALGFSRNHYRDGALQSWKPSGTGIEAVGHGGGQEKTRTYMVILPEQRQAAVVMTNSENGNSKRIAERLLQVMRPTAPKPAE